MRHILTLIAILLLGTSSVAFAQAAKKVTEAELKANSAEKQKRAREARAAKIERQCAAKPDFQKRDAEAAKRREAYRQHQQRSQKVAHERKAQRRQDAAKRHEARPKPQPATKPNDQ